MKKIIILISFIGFCFATENTYTVLVKQKGQIVKYKSVSYKKTLGLTVVFIDSSGKSFELKKRKIKAIYDYKNKKISIRNLKVNPYAPIYKPKEIQKKLDSVGTLLIDSGVAMSIGELLPLFGMVHFYLYADPAIFTITTVSGILVRFYSYGRLIEAGKIMTKQEETND